MIETEKGRREFLKGTAWMGLAAVAAGCMGRGMKLTCGSGAPMQGWADKPMDVVRIGIVGFGHRGLAGARRLAVIPGAELVAFCDIVPERVEKANAWRVKNGYRKAREYTGPDGFQRMCDADDIDVIYNMTCWEIHNYINCMAMEHGKHVMTEVPGALTIEECWQQVETSERTKRHCYMLENMCYCEDEMLALNMVRLGLFGEIVHGEGAYIHDSRASFLPPDDPNRKVVFNNKVTKGVGPDPWTDYWAKKHGALYSMHGLGPIARCMNINHGDRFEYLVSVESKAAALEAFAKARFPKGTWQHDYKVIRGDISSSLIRTALGRSILVQHNTMSPRPYSRLNLLMGTLGEFRGFPELKFAFEEKIGDLGADQYFDAKKTKELAEKYRHPLWKVAGDVARRIGGHWGGDTIMDLRWIYCLRNGLPMDMDVYDMAAWSCIFECTSKSMAARSSSVDIPDFTRGAWKTAAPFPPETFEPGKIDLRNIGNAGEQYRT